MTADRLTDAELDAAEAQIEAARKMVSRLCYGGQRWVMSVPARPDEDPDLVISAGLRAGLDALGQLREARAAIREQRRVRIEQAAEIKRLRKAIQDVIDLADVVDATSEMALTIRRAALACPACGATREEDCRGVDLAEGCQPLGVQP